MKNLLLASTAIVAFSGAAFAEAHTGITFSGVASLGFNDTDVNDAFVDDDNDGFYADLEITIGLAAELDNGLVAAASIDLEDLAAGQDSGESGNSEDGIDVAGTTIDYELSITNDMAGLYYGDTQFAAERMWVSAGDMEGDNFSEADGEEVLRGEVMFNDIEMQLSYVLADADGERVRSDGSDDDEVDQLSVGVAGDFGNFNVVAAYQEESDTDIDGNGDFTSDEVFGISVGTSFAGADVRLAYAENNGGDNDSSIGVQASLPVGPVTATVYYVAEDSDGGNDDDNYGLTLGYSEGPVTVEFDYDNDQGVDKYGIEGAYDVGNGLTMFAGYLQNDGIESGDEDAFYVAGTYDLGSGAQLLVSYAEGDADEYEDEIGAGDYQEGTTVEVSFEF